MNNEIRINGIIKDYCGVPFLESEEKEIFPFIESEKQIAKKYIGRRVRVIIQPEYPSQTKRAGIICFFSNEAVPLNTTIKEHVQKFSTIN